MTLVDRDVPELLAPSGGPEALRAAVANGADAVYLGVDRLNARRGAENFTLDGLAETCRYAHLRGVRVYLTVNVVVLPTELDEALALIDRAWTAGVDAVILQDLGLVRIVRQALPHVRVHGSTQLNTHSSASVTVLASRGVARVTLARELSTEEIARLVSAGARCGVEIESFVHGALCMSYSGQCLLSSLIGGRSANRGLCAQPCRLAYELTDDRGEVLATPGAHLLSPKDLAGITMLPELLRAGVAALKIEGRMKSADYVALVTGTYRAALDRAAADPVGYEVRDGEMAVLREAFSRGFTEAYLRAERGNDMMSYRRPNNRGVPVGRISAADGTVATVAFESQVDSEDTVEIWTSRGRFAQRIGPLRYAGGQHRMAPAGTRAEMTLEGKAAVGDRVFRVRNAALAAAAERTYAHGEGATVPLSVSVRMVIGEPLRVEVSDDAGHAASADGPVVEAARTRAVSAEDVIEHVGRFRGTAYAASSWDVVVSPGAGIGFSVLHHVRGEAIEHLERSVLAPWADRLPSEPALPYLPPPHRNARPAPRLVATAADLPTARACLQAGCESVHVPVEALGNEPPARGIVALLPRVCHDGETEAVLARVSPGATAVAGTLGLVHEAANRGAVVEAHWSLNALNAHAVAELADIGASFVWLSPELSSRQIASVAPASPVPVGVAVYGRQEVMVTEHCVLMAEGECAQRCVSCERRQGWRFLRDRKGYSFPVRTDTSGRTHIYNAVPLDLTHALDEVLATGVAALRLDLETERANSAAKIVATVRQSLQEALAGRPISHQKRDGVTSGHFFRGVK